MVVQRWIGSEMICRLLMVLMPMRIGTGQLGMIRNLVPRVDDELRYLHSTR